MPSFGVFFWSARNWFVTQHSKFAKEEYWFYRLDYLAVTQKVKIPGINYPFEQWQMRVLSAPNYSVGLHSSHPTEL